MLVYYALATLIVCIDQFTKYLVVQNIPLHSAVEFIPKVVSLTYIQNNGAAWSILEGQFALFYIVTAIVTITIIYYLQKYAKGDRLLALSLSFILGGTIGNFIDRLFLKYVIDMIQLEFIHFPIFNIADSALVIGVALLIVYLIIDEIQTKKAK